MRTSLSAEEVCAFAYFEECSVDAAFDRRTLATDVMKQAGLARQQTRFDSVIIVSQTSQELHNALFSTELAMHCTLASFCVASRSTILTARIVGGHLGTVNVCQPRSRKTTAN